MVSIDGHHLTIEEVVRVARGRETVELSEQGKQAIQESRRRLEQILKTGKAVYGINTGFGIFADRRIAPEESAQLSRNLILSHAVGTGPDLPENVVRAAMLVRANTLAKGYSGVRLEIVQTLIDMLNCGVTPVVPSQGSLGSSG
ncbi:MAG TPA: aromatic amino acid lyase, partial [Anaerolineaceae bacterium]|nr:aromatic amino acid lyase [Anaerolineaceae bacterium]